MKKKTVAKLKVTRKLEGILPAFFMLVCIPRHHNKKKLPSRQLLLHIPRPVSIGLYQRFFKYIDDFSTYISDFFIISTVRHRISTYRHFSTINFHLYTSARNPKRNVCPASHLTIFYLNFTTMLLNNCLSNI